MTSVRAGGSRMRGQEAASHLPDVNHTVTILGHSARLIGSPAARSCVFFTAAAGTIVAHRWRMRRRTTASHDEHAAGAGNPRDEHATLEPRGPPAHGHAHSCGLSFGDTRHLS